ncbi:hypothetical protein CPAR01_10538 [Colletotrichum paranaense]|uniref:Uncharacterized protein n=1 Tax=Colletotrichum paranaense TaxID=1914294 RepID=A0ABQ9SEA1_9PEZI|nr:uncharacterized protein CPAR01_10538 [Colletotrichum paranaense]KAK1533830.1 hypothetical protein CPAR01_10538 [Colletotrichum paranaense]
MRLPHGNIDRRLKRQIPEWWHGCRATQYGGGTYPALGPCFAPSPSNKAHLEHQPAYTSAQITTQIA